MLHNIEFKTILKKIWTHFSLVLFKEVGQAAEVPAVELFIDLINELSDFKRIAVDNNEIIHVHQRKNQAT